MTVIAYIALMSAFVGGIALAYLLGRIDQRKNDENQLRRMIAEIKAKERKMQ